MTVEMPGRAQPLVLAESAAIAVPKRYQDGKDGRLSFEVESWLRYRYYMHYAEGGYNALDGHVTAHEHYQKWPGALLHQTSHQRHRW